MHVGCTSGARAARIGQLVANLPGDLPEAAVGKLGMQRVNEDACTTPGSIVCCRTAVVRRDRAAVASACWALIAGSKPVSRGTAAHEHD
jgi:hypothetical protein